VLPYTAALRASNFTNEITLSFNAIRSNGILAHDNTYHFVFTYTVRNDSLVELTPINEYCKFSPPLRFVDDLSLRFSDPIVPIEFNVDRMYASSINYLSSDGRITFASAHNLTTGDVVIVRSLTTLDDAKNTNILSRIHSARGMPITVINSTTISIGIDFSLIDQPDTNSKPLVVFYSNTFRFPLEIGYQDITEMN
jgi:hypothetical protein